MAPVALNRSSEATGKRGVDRIDLLVGNVEHRNDDAALLERRADRRGIDDGRVVAAGPVAVGNAFDLRILCAVGDEEDVRQRKLSEKRTPTVAIAVGDAAEGGVDMRAAGAEI